MKNFFKLIFASLLAFFARAVVAKYRPKIVMVTGSVGKTSTKDAIVAALSSSFYIYGSKKNYNNEFGVPITIFNIEKPRLTPLGYLHMLKEALSLLVLPNHYPNLLVLEVGADRPGDMERILRIATPNVVVVTLLPDVPVHVEAYATPAAVREEEFAPAYALAPASPLVILKDDPFALELALHVPARLITYGQADGATVRVSDIGFYTEEERVTGMQAKAETPEGVGELIVKGSVGTQQILPAAAALAAASALHVPLASALAALQAYEPPPGRGRIFTGINGSVIIDDSYNASPAAVEEALKTLSAFPNAKRRIAVIGDMLELGRYSVGEHERIGRLANECAEVVLSVGIRARHMGVNLAYDSAELAALHLPELIQEGDVILIKGSQSVRMERIVEVLLADPADISKLVRQEKEWKKR